MWRVDTTIVGAGQAGLAVSRLLTDLGIDHVVLERAAVAAHWRAGRRGTPRLLTPNWMTRLPGWRYRGPDPSGFMTLPEVAGFLRGYARSFDAPVLAGAGVRSVHHGAGGYRVRTDAGEIRSRAVVVATGGGDLARLPPFADRAHPALTQLTAARYSGPELLGSGGVLVVGAGASGVQAAWQLRAAGVPVVLAAGRHTRLPRTYRGHDIHYWLELLGLLRLPAGTGSADRLSVQLAGSVERHDVDLRTLQERGVVLAGRLVDLDGRRARFDAGLPGYAAEADRRLERLLRRIDEHIAATGHPAGPAPSAAGLVRPADTGAAPRELDLAAAGITTVLWATGYRRRYPWLRVPVLRPVGPCGAADLIHHHGVTPAPGLYAVGLPLQSRRNSTLLDGVGHDARQIAGHVARHLGRVPVPAAA